MKIRKFNEKNDYISTLENPEDLFQDVQDEFGCECDCSFKFFESDIDLITSLVSKSNYTNYVLNNNNKAKYGYNYSFYFDLINTNIDTNPLFYIYESVKRKNDLIDNFDIHIKNIDTAIEIFLISKEIIDISKFSKLYKLLDDQPGVSTILDDKETLCILGPNSEKAYNSLFYIDTYTGKKIAKKLYNLDFELEKEFEIEKIERQGLYPIIKFKLKK